MVVAAIFVAAARLKIENPRGLWTITPRPPPSQLWTFARSQFGDREVLLVAARLVSGASGRDTASSDLERWIREQPEVANVIGPRDVGRLTRSIGIGPLAAMRRELARAVFSPDSALSLIYATLQHPSRLEVKANFLSKLADQGPGLVPRNTEILIAGQPAVDVGLDRLLHRDMATAVPLALGFVAFALLLLLGAASAAPGLGVAASVMILLGGMAAAGLPVSSATAVALPLTVVVGISYATHMTMSIERTGNARTALAEIRTPLTWSYVTTAVALASFVLSPIRALRLFAISSTVGVTIAFAAAVTLVPCVHPLFVRRRSRSRRRKLSRAALAVFAVAARRRTPAVVILIFLGILAITGAAQVVVEPNSYLGLFPDGHPIVHAHRELDRSFGGSVPVHVLVRVDSGLAYRQSRVRERIRAFVREAASNHRLGPSFVPPNARLLERDSSLAASVAAWFEGRDPRYTRAIFSMPIMTTAEVRELMRQLDLIAASYSDEAVQLQVTGLLPAAIPMQRALFESQVKSLALLLAVVSIFLITGAQKWRRGLVLLVPNLLAVTFVIGVMGYLGIPLDFTTVSVSSLVLGVAVDDTFQIAWAGTLRRSSRSSFHAPLALRRTAVPIVASSLAMALGSAGLMLSQFPPTRRLGGLLAVGLLAALLADLTLTPLLLTSRQQGFKERRET